MFHLEGINIPNLNYYVKSSYFPIILEDLNSADSELQLCLSKYVRYSVREVHLQPGSSCLAKDLAIQRIEISPTTFTRSNLHIFRLPLKRWIQLMQGYNYVSQSMWGSQRAPPVAQRTMSGIRGVCLMTALPLTVCRTEFAEAAVNGLAMVSLLHERGSFCMCGKTPFVSAN